MDELITYLQNPETPFGVFDLVYGTYFLISFIRGLFRGLPEELSQLLGTLLIFWGGSQFYTPVSEYIISHTRLEEPAASKALAYVLIVLVFLIAWKLLTFLIRKTLDWTCPKQLRRFGGAAVGPFVQRHSLPPILPLLRLRRRGGCIQICHGIRASRFHGGNGKTGPANRGSV
jgi:hypothetical protein